MRILCANEVVNVRMRILCANEVVNVHARQFNDHACAVCIHLHGVLYLMLASSYRVCKGRSFTARHLASYASCSVLHVQYRIIARDARTDGRYPIRGASEASSLLVDILL